MTNGQIVSSEVLDSSTVVIEGRIIDFVAATKETRVPMLMLHERSGKIHIAHANKSVLEMLGYDLVEITDLEVSAIFEYAFSTEKSIIDFISEKENSTGRVNARRKDGTGFQAVLLVSPILLEDGVLPHYSLSVVNVDGELQAEKNRSPDADIYTHAPGFIALSAGPAHNLTFVNSSFEELVGRRELVGRPVALALPELGAQGFVAMLDLVYATGERRVGKRTPVALRRNGSQQEETRYVDFLYQAVRNSAGRVTGIFCEGSDVTEAHQASQNLVDARAEVAHLSRVNSMGTMAATLAHELNQPLAAISNYASGCVNILENSPINAAKLTEGLAAIGAASDRAGKVIKHLRDLTSRAPPVNEVFDLSEALEEAVNLIQAGGCDDVTISIQCTPALSVRGDTIQAQQVIINLLRNACQAAAERTGGGAVIATSHLRDEYACVTVRDNGLGFSPDAVSDVFQWTKSTKRGGMGIGLSICRTIAETYGGNIALDWSGPSGTSFTFCLPRADGGAN